MREYRFENLIPFIRSSQKLKSGWYRGGQGRDVDEMVVFTTTVAAKEESQHNFDVMLERAREKGVEYLVFGYNGVQILANKDVFETKEIGDYILNDFRAQLNNTKDSDGYGLFHLYNPTTETSKEGYSFYQVYTYYGKELSLKKNMGFFEVKTGKKITKREEILKLLWDMGFLAERRRILYAASLTQGSPEEIRTFQTMKSKIDTLPKRSFLRDSFYTAWRKLNRTCDYPGYY